MLSTATKIRFASVAVSVLLAAGLKPERRIVRRGIAYEVDLREGIDFSLFLLGTFQGHVLRFIRQNVPVDGVVIDVGANVGALTLPIAAFVENGHVYAFEPTAFAFSKLQRNIELNPQIGERITRIQSFVADGSADVSALAAYSSWPLGGAKPPDLHPDHRGALQRTSCGQTTLDAFVSERALDRVSLIKIDTDGHEYAVLSGALRCLERLRPIVVFEACEYLMRPPRRDFTDFEALFAKVGYTITLGAGRRRLGPAEFLKKCPRGGGLDLVAVPT